ncbi:MAG: HAD-IB family phosphatase [Steroidobacterales bacterium]
MFDLDGTLTWRDTLLPFLARYIAQRPSRLLRLWRLPWALASYVFTGGDRGVLKAQLIRMAMARDPRPAIDLWARQFVASMQGSGIFRPEALAVLEAHRRAGHHLVLMSASPDLYVPYVATLLGFERAVCTLVNWRGERLDGTLRTANCRGQEKLRQLAVLRSEYPGASFVAYGNSGSDIAHLRQADRATLVNAGAGARRLARRLGLEVTEWR